MMIVNVQEIEIKKDKIKKNISDYYSNFLNYYNELSIIESNWHDGNSLPFFEAIEETKKVGKSVYQSVKQLIKIYSFIVTEYQKMGDKIEYDLDNSDRVIYKIEELDAKLDDILKQYFDLQMSNINVEFKDIIYRQEERIKRVKEQLGDVKDKNKELSVIIEEINAKVKSKLSKIDIVIVQDEEYPHWIKQLDEIVVNPNEMDISLKKLEMYKKEEDLIIEELENNFKDISYDYHTDYEDEIKELQTELINNLKSIDIIHENNILKITKHKDEFIESSDRIQSSL